MAETQAASIGWGAELHVNDGTTLVEIVQVTSLTPPSGEAERVEYTHLKSPGRRRQYKPGLIGDGEATATLNFRPGSTSDTLLRAAKAAGDDREIKMVFPEDGEAAYQVTFLGAVTGYEVSEVTADEIMTVEVTFTVSDEETWAVAA